MIHDQRDTAAVACSPTWSVLICLFGSFRVLTGGQSLSLPHGGKTEALLTYLALRWQNRVPRETLLDVLWPEYDERRAGQSLNSLIYNIHKLLREVLGSASPIMQADGYYCLNTKAGVAVDVACFTSLVEDGDRHARADDGPAAAQAYTRASELYHGDLAVGSDLLALLEREHLRTRYLGLLAWLAEHTFAERQFEACLDHTQRLLDCDPCREDAHRMAMRCFVRRGERAQAMRQYRLCEEILRAEFNAAPESATVALYELVRLDPDSI